MKNTFYASWVRGCPAYWLDGKRVKRSIGYQYAISNKIDLPEEFLFWHAEND